MPERVDFWGIPTTWGSPAIYVYFLMFMAAAILLLRFYWRARLWWQIGRPEARWDHILARLGRLLQYALAQSRILRQRYAGLMHVCIAWSFLVFFIGTGLATVDAHFYKILVGTPYLLHKLVMDCFALVFFIGAGLAAYRRFIQKPARLTLSAEFTYSLLMLTLIVAGGLLTESLRLAVEKPAWGWWSPLGWLLAQAWIASGASEAALLNWHLGIWVFHLLTVAVTLITLPTSTLVHILTSSLNIFFATLDRPTGQLATLPTDTSGNPIFASTLRDLSWKQLLEGEACTECGRCQEVCPAFASGKPLSPKQAILAIRQALRTDGPALLRGAAVPPLVGTRISDEILWSCTTCGACVYECPVLIHHVDTIVDLRRYLVVEGRMDAELQSALENLGRYGNSFGQSERMRARWASSIQPAVKDARREAVEYLWFVGDYASYSPALTEITRKTAEVFQRAGLNFGILYEAERNAGNDVRRVGEEGLFEMLRDKNLQALNKCKFETIVTTDPHTYNTLKNEYPWNGNRPPILHYTELLDQLLTSGQLKPKRKLNVRITYHDPCYLARYNDVQEAPRRVLRALGCELIEMPRHGKRAFCCGAGGGRIWMAEGEIRERPSEIRIREAATLDGVHIFVVACPKDVTMFRDAVKTTGYEGRLEVRDLIELIYEAL